MTFTPTPLPPQPLRYEIPGYPRYAISRDGTLYGPRSCVHGMSDDVSRPGYFKIGGKYVSLKRLLCLAFYGPQPSEWHEARIIDRNKEVTADNVHWRTR